MVFESPVAEPWSFGGVTAAHSNNCNCKCAAGAEACAREGKSPLIWANGLIAQHNCGTAIDQLGRWQEVRRPKELACPLLKSLSKPELPKGLERCRRGPGEASCIAGQLMRSRKPLQLHCACCTPSTYQQRLLQAVPTLRRQGSFERQGLVNLRGHLPRHRKASWHGTQAFAV